jgi:hypothetical protein
VQKDGVHGIFPNNLGVFNDKIVYNDLLIWTLLCTARSWCTLYHKRECIYSRRLSDRVCCSL